MMLDNYLLRFRGGKYYSEKTECRSRRSEPSMIMMFGAPPALTKYQRQCSRMLLAMGSVFFGARC